VAIAKRSLGAATRTRTPAHTRTRAVLADIAVIGGGQSGLAAGYYLRRTALRFTLLDDGMTPGGAWQHTWPSLRLFSPAQWSSLPGWILPRDADDAPDGYPSRDAAIHYLTEYERRYDLPVERPVHVHGVHRADDGFRLDTTRGDVHARAIVSATGTWSAPVLPLLPGQADFRGVLLHSATYAGPSPFAGRRVIVVGGGNSGAQILAELSETAHVTWATREPPRFLPDDVDGRYLFEQATARYRALQEGRTPDPTRSRGDIVMVPPVRAARERGVLRAEPMFARFTADGVVWPDGREERVDAVIFATGFRPALGHLAPLGVLDAEGRVEVARDGSGTRAVREPMLWLLGYGEWTGFASATLIGVGRTARAAVDEISAALGAPPR
jgi:cation diffusion facilitator CzcD-associated flavoprotein CzcO